jgi:hypothetical protein
MSHVTLLCAIQVHQFFVMGQGIMNNPVYTQVDLELTEINNYFTSSSIKRYSKLDPRI